MRQNQIILIETTAAAGYEWVLHSNPSPHVLMVKGKSNLSDPFLWRVDPTTAHLTLPQFVGKAHNGAGKEQYFYKALTAGKRDALTFFYR